MKANMNFLLLGTLGFLFAGCTGLDARDPSATSCGDLVKENIKLLTITANKPGTPTASPDDLTIKAGGLIIVQFVGNLDKGKNIRMRWNRVDPKKGTGSVKKNGDWLDKGNKRRNSIRVINVPCEAADQADQVFYKYDISVRDGGDADPRVVVEPPQ